MEGKKDKSTGLWTGLLFGALGVAVGLVGKTVFDELSQEEKEKERERQKALEEIRDDRKKKKAEYKNPDENQVTIDAEYESFFCPISQEIMKDPVITPHGISYERKSILDWLKKCNSCPITKNILTEGDLIPNYALKNIIDDYLIKVKNNS